MGSVYAANVTNIPLVWALSGAGTPEDASLVVERLRQVGQATLKVLFWEIYDSTLYSKDGSYRGITPELALNLKYKRAISRDQLIESTKSEWIKQNLYDPAIYDLWLGKLNKLWPNVESNDEIMLYVDANLASHFFYNQRKIGVISDPAFTESFLAIWLSANTSHPKVRKKLLKLEPDS